jgi:hypothetical protein
VSGVAIYGRTYLDAEVTIPLDHLATGKGKVDADVRLELGGLPCNAARALLGRLSPSDVTVVTKISSLDLPRLRAALPPSTSLVAIDSGTIDWPVATVIINPATDCRLLRSGRAGDLCAADLADIPRASLHIFGRVAADLVHDVRRRAPSGALLAWCAGASDSEALHACDLVCVNTAEARALVGDHSATTRDLAAALAERAPAGGIRVVTGRADAPSIAAVRENGRTRFHERAPAPVERSQIRRLKGVGDAFAAHLFVDAVLDDRGQPRAALDIEHALAAAQRFAGAFMTSEAP